MALVEWGWGGAILIYSFIINVKISLINYPLSFILFSSVISLASGSGTFLGRLIYSCIKNSAVHKRKTLKLMAVDFFPELLKFLFYIQFI